MSPAAPAEITELVTGIYLTAFYAINRMATDAAPLVWVVHFALVEP